MSSSAASEIELLDVLFERAAIRPLRTIAQFAEDEIIVPSGPDEGLPFRLDRHPVSRLLFAELDSGRWSRAFVTGPNQDGKTFMSFVIVVMFLLFERGERVGLGVPSAAIAEDKWFGELLPVISRTRYKDYLPTRGSGSRGSFGETTWFTNGGALRVFTGGGDDQSRAGFTTSNLVTTEVDGFDDVGSSSREGTKYGQLQKRVLAFDDDQSFELGECTVSTEVGRTWFEYANGTQSRIAIPCPHCAAFVTPGRDHFVGWQGAKDEQAAEEGAAIRCPTCGVAWTNDQRLAANRLAVLVHRGQDVDANGVVTGDAPRTRTLGFRWDCVNSAVNPNRMRRVARQEWASANMPDGEKAEAAEKDLRQSHWVVPAKSSTSDVRVIEAVSLQQRMLADYGPGVVPDDAEFVTVGCDVGRHLLHWTGIAWRGDGSPHVLEYSRIDVPSGQLADDLAIPNALRQFRDRVDAGWKTRDGRQFYSALNFVDAGWHQWIVLGAVNEFGEPWFASKGYGADQRKTGEYKRDTGSKRLDAGEAYAFIELTTGDRLWEFDADHWKSWWHNRLATKRGEPGAFTLFQATKANEHLAYVKHQLNERQQEEFVPGVGLRRRFVNPTGLPNHWLDSSVLAAVAGHVAGSRIADPGQPPAPARAAVNAAAAHAEPADRERATARWLPHVSNWIG